MEKYDLVVIGTGVGASSAAYQCREAGLKVAVVDKNPFGGTCALRGCDPKKVLVGAAEIMDSIKRMQGKGIDPGSAINWHDLMAFKRTFTDPVPEKNEKAYEEAGIDSYHGTASFISHNQLQVNGEQMEFGHLLIASGSRPQPLGIGGEEHVRTSDDFLELDRLPDRLVFIGGGYISFEFAHVAARAGAEVHIIHRSAKPLKHFDQDLVALLVKRSREVGIQVHLDMQPESIEKQAEGFVVHVKHGGESIQMECDMVFHGAGRIPDIEELDLETGNVKADRKGIVVNEFLQSVSNPL
ncbi:MAG TPA: NAD(P)/FAD-dependent oxidoreductase, partial [Clostridiaceae bacterium]|nr:NAD(P)/FAD-dependent oxidoreductase [Clostridiaceae bacterium]